jgi:hypothetical protein
MRLGMIRGLLLALIISAPLHARTGATSSADAKASSANPAPSGQAPEEATRKITELVHGGKYAEAQQLTTGLLLAYPYDQRLIKAKALIENLLAPAGSANATPASSHPAANTNVQLSGMDKIDYSALIVMAREAQQTIDLAEQQKLLQQFIDQSSAFLRKHPDQMLLWQLRAASAISLNEPLVGFEAGQKLLAMGAADSDDPSLQQLLGQLKNKGWLDKQEAEKSYEQLRYVLVIFQGEPGGKTPDIDLRATLERDMTALLQSQFPSRQINFSTPAVSDPAPILTVTVNVYGTTLSPCVYSAWKNIWKCPAETSLAVTASSLQGWQFNKTYSFTNGTSGVGWGTARTPLDKNQIDSWISQGVAGAFKEILDAGVTSGFMTPAVRTTMNDANPEASDAGSPPPVDTPAPRDSTPFASSPARMNSPTAKPATRDFKGSAPVDNPTAQSAESAGGSFASTNSPVPSLPQVAATAPAATNTTVLHVYRPHRVIAAMQQPYIYIDGKKIMPIGNSQQVRILVAPGKHNISVSNKWLDDQIPVNDIDMGAGKEYWIRVDISSGAWSAHTKLYVVPNDQAQSESTRMEEIKVGDASMH